MVRLALLAICLLPIAVLTPILEISPTHVSNPDWPGHARLHEVWQLITHAAIAALALWLAWAKGQMRLASLLGLLVNSGFLASVLLAPAYGGTMQHSDGTELTVGGVNLAVAIMIVATAVLLGLNLTSPKISSPPVGVGGNAQ